MSEKDPKLFARAEEFLSLFNKGADFTRELLKENERLRSELLHVTDRQETAARSPEEWDKLRGELNARIASLEEECTSVRERLDHVERENSQFAQRYVEIEEENNNLANLYVASYQLHSTLDLDEVLKIIMEIVINLVGAEVFAVYLLDEEQATLSRRSGPKGLELDAFPTTKLGSGRARQGRRRERGHLLGHGALRRPLPADRVRAPGRAEPTGRRDRGVQPAAAEGRLLGPRPRALQHARRPCGHRDLRGEALLPERAQAEHDPGFHRSADELSALER